MTNKRTGFEEWYNGPQPFNKLWSSNEAVARLAYQAGAEEMKRKAVAKCKAMRMDHGPFGAELMFDECADAIERMEV